MFIPVLLLIILCLIIKWKYNKKKFYEEIEKIPGPKGLPLLGNIFDLTFDYKKLLTRIHELQKEYGPVYKLWMGPELKVIISDPDTIRQVLGSSKNIDRTDAYNVLKPWLGDGVILENGSKWKAIRKQLMPTFNLNILKSFMDVNNHHSNILIKQLNKELDKKIDVLPFMYAVAVDIITETILGESFNLLNNTDNKFVKYCDKVMTLSMKRVFSMFQRNDLIFKLYPNHRKLKKAIAYLDNFMDNIITKRQFELEQSNYRNKFKSILDLLLESNETSNLLNVRYNLNGILFAGFDTTTISLCFALYELAKRPEIQEKLYIESVEFLGKNKDSPITYDSITKMKYLDCVIKETLRLNPPGPFIERKLLEDIYYNKLKIPSGTNVSIFIYGTHLSETIYENANVFDPDRFFPENSKNLHPYAFIPFSAGPRNCLGFVYAEFEFKTVLCKIIRNFKIEAVSGYKPDVVGIGIVRILNGLQVTLKRR